MFGWGIAFQNQLHLHCHRFEQVQLTYVYVRPSKFDWDYKQISANSWLNLEEQIVRVMLEIIWPYRGILNPVHYYRPLVIIKNVSHNTTWIILSVLHRYNESMCALIMTIICKLLYFKRNTPVNHKTHEACALYLIEYLYFHVFVCVYVFAFGFVHGSVNAMFYREHELRSHVSLRPQMVSENYTILCWILHYAFKTVCPVVHDLNTNTQTHKRARMLAQTLHDGAKQ